MLKFEEILSKEDLIDYFEGQDFKTIEVDNGVEKNSKQNEYLRIEELKAMINNSLRTIGNDKKTMLKSDAHFSRMIFNQLKYYPRRELTDIRFWQYIGLKYLQNYIWSRWEKSVKINTPLKNDDKIRIIKSTNKDDNDIWSSITTRFLGGTSLKSLTSRHAIVLYQCMIFFDPSANRIFQRLAYCAVDVF